MREVLKITIFKYSYSPLCLKDFKYQIKYTWVWILYLILTIQHAQIASETLITFWGQCLIAENKKT